MLHFECLCASKWKHRGNGIKTSTQRSEEDTDERWTPNEIVKWISTIKCWTCCHCSYIQCHDILELRNDGPVIVVEELHYCNTLVANGGIMRRWKGKSLSLCNCITKNEKKTSGMIGSENSASSMGKKTSSQFCP